MKRTTGQKIKTRLPVVGKGDVTEGAGGYLKTVEPVDTVNFVKTVNFVSTIATSGL